MFTDSRLFRLIVDEVEKTLSYVDLEMAREYAELVPEARVRDDGLRADRGGVPPHGRGGAADQRRDASWPSGSRGSAGGSRAGCRRSIRSRRQQIELLRRFRESGSDKSQEELLSALLLSINCIAAGFGATG